MLFEKSTTLYIKIRREYYHVQGSIKNHFYMRPISHATSTTASENLNFCMRSPIPTACGNKFDKKRFQKKNPNTSLPAGRFSRCLSAVANPEGGSGRSARCRRSRELGWDGGPACPHCCRPPPADLPAAVAPEGGGDGSARPRHCRYSRGRGRWICPQPPPLPLALAWWWRGEERGEEKRRERGGRGKY